MIIKRFIGNIFATNTYLIRKKGSEHFVCVDPSYDTANAIIAHLKKERGDLKYIVNTHGHFDHIAENAALKRATGAEMCISEKETEVVNLRNGMIEKVSGLLQNQKEKSSLKKIEEFAPDWFLQNGDTIMPGELDLRVVETPGHSAGSVCLYNKNAGVLFTGDTLFSGSYGRVDLPTSDFEKIKASMKALAKYPAETKIYPGHGDATTIGKEKEWIEQL